MEILSADVTRQSRIYKRKLQESGVKVVLPTEGKQRAINDLICNGIRAGKQDVEIAEFLYPLDDLKNRGAETLVLGCTELPLAFQ